MSVLETYPRVVDSVNNFQFSGGNKTNWEDRIADLLEPIVSCFFSETFREYFQLTISRRFPEQINFVPPLPLFSVGDNEIIAMEDGDTGGSGMLKIQRTVWKRGRPVYQSTLLAEFYYSLES